MRAEISNNTREVRLRFRGDFVDAARVSRRVLHSGFGQLRAERDEVLNILDAGARVGTFDALLQCGLGSRQVKPKKSRKVRVIWCVQHVQMLALFRAAKMMTTGASSAPAGWEVI